jgi:hypothetical protein
MGGTRAARLSARIEALIDRQDGGDRIAAARRLGLRRERLEGLLSGDWRRFSLDGLTALVQGYGVSLDWLLAPLDGRRVPITAGHIGTRSPRPGGPREARCRSPHAFPRTG